MGHKLEMRCFCGASLWVQVTGKVQWSRPMNPRAAMVRCKACGEVFDYACWLVRTRSGRCLHKVEAYPRGVTAAAIAVSPRCEECAACQEWMLAPAQAPWCTGQMHRRRGIIEVGRPA